VDPAKIIAYSNQIIEFDELEAREILLEYCRSKIKDANAPSAFQLRRAIIDKRDQWRLEAETMERCGQIQLGEPMKPPEEVKSLVADLVKKLGN
jgi:hypothetical protein